MIKYCFRTIQWNPSIVATTGERLFGHYRGWPHLRVFSSSELYNYSTIIIEKFSTSLSLSREVRPRPAEKFSCLVGYEVLTVSKMARRGLKHSNTNPGSVLLLERLRSLLQNTGSLSRARRQLAALESVDYYVNHKTWPQRGVKLYRWASFGARKGSHCME